MATGAIVHVPTDPLPDLVQWQAQTGPRRGGLAGLQAQDMNLDRRRLHICRQLMEVRRQLQESAPHMVGPAWPR